MAMTYRLNSCRLPDNLINMKRDSMPESLFAIAYCLLPEEDYFFFSPPEVGGLDIESRMLVSASIFFIR